MLFINLIGVISARSGIKFVNFISSEARGIVAKISLHTYALKFLSARTLLKFSSQLRHEISRAV